MEKKLYIWFNDMTRVDINTCVIPNPDVTVVYNDYMEMIPDLQTIRNADKSFVRIRSVEDDRDIYEFYNMELGSTQILENGDGTITVHYYFREIG